RCWWWPIVSTVRFRGWWSLLLLDVEALLGAGVGDGRVAAGLGESAQFGGVAGRVGVLGPAGAVVGGVGVVACRTVAGRGGTGVEGGGGSAGQRLGGGQVVVGVFVVLL